MEPNTTVELVRQSSPLGKESLYISHYSPSLLCSIPRSLKRDEISVPSPLPFHGNDLWTGFELSWLNAKGKPVVAILEFIIPCTSPFLAESKSIKLYLNSFNQTKFDDFAAVKKTITQDLSKATGSQVQVTLFSSKEFSQLEIQEFPGECLDDLDIDCDNYHLNPNFLVTHNKIVTETLSSHLLKSNCLVTGQPDWGSVFIHYSGKQIDHAGLLKYLVSFREHQEFHEQCVERIFMDISKICQPEKLTVYARYTRRGGLDINPFRSNFEETPKNIRLARQ